MSTELALDLEIVHSVDSHKTKEKPAESCEVTCPKCKQAVRRGRTRATLNQPSVEVLLDPWEHSAYCMVYEASAKMPTLIESSGYPVHRCGAYRIVEEPGSDASKHRLEEAV